MRVYADRVVAKAQAGYHLLVRRNVVCWACHVALDEIFLTTMVPVVGLLGWRSASPLVPMVADKAVVGDDVVAISAIFDSRL